MPRDSNGARLEIVNQFSVSTCDRVLRKWTESNTEHVLPSKIFRMS
jgi:hypothetical protein